MKHDYIGCRTSPYYVNDCAADPSRARNGYTAARSTDDVVAIIDVSVSIVDYNTSHDRQLLDSTFVRLQYPALVWRPMTACPYICYTDCWKTKHDDWIM